MVAMMLKMFQAQIAIAFASHWKDFGFIILYS